MYDDDRDALAAEYVLGTLSPDERDQAEALLIIDPGFAEIVGVWERRLGELNVMVEAVEPPADVWEKIRAGSIGTGTPVMNKMEAGMPAIEGAVLASSPSPNLTAEMTPEDGTAELTPDLLLENAPHVPQDLDELNLNAQDLNAQHLGAENLDAPHLASQEAAHLDASVPPQDLDAASPVDLDDPSLVAGLASSLLPPEPSSDVQPPSESSPPAQSERSADIVHLQQGVRRWRGLTFAMSAIAALLAIYVAVSQFAPGLLPQSRQPQMVTAAKTQPPSSRLVAVLQQEPTAPAFLVTVDPQSRTLTVRRVSAAPEANRSYELWLMAGKNQGPRSLGLVGANEFTTRPLPANFDIDTMRTASYAISLEPAGGSSKGEPTGPVLFTGRMVESVADSPPPS